MAEEVEILYQIMGEDVGWDKSMDSASDMTVFFELIQVAVGNRRQLSRVLTANEWHEVFDMCVEQTLVGIGYVGIQKLPREQWPSDRMLIVQWTVIAEKLKERNMEVSRDCVAVCSLLKNDGFHSCILKGQSNLRNYGDLGMYRTSGDIDVWVWSDSGKVKDVIHYVRQRNNMGELTYHHADCTLVGDTETEVHHRPSWMSSPWRNRTFQSFCKLHKDDVEEYDGYWVPSVKFDAVYQLVHIYRHLFYEGIGLRQIVDYYMVLKNLSPTLSQGEGDGRSREEAMAVLEKLGMKRFCGAVMWVLHKVLGMPEEYMLCEPCEKEGRFLLKEIMLAGNFGHADKRITVGKYENRAKWGWMKLMRNMKFIGSYPEEVIFEPLFRVYHWCWRTFKLWKI